MTVVVLVLRWRSASAPLRRVLAPMLWGAVLLALADAYMVIIGRALDGRPGTLSSYAFGLFSVGLLVGMLRTRRHRSVVADLGLLELGEALGADTRARCAVAHARRPFA